PEEAVRLVHPPLVGGGRGLAGRDGRRTLRGAYGRAHGITPVEGYPTRIPYPGRGESPVPRFSGPNVAPVAGRPGRQSSAGKTTKPPRPAVRGGRHSTVVVVVVAVVVVVGVAVVAAVMAHVAAVGVAQPGRVR